MSLTPHYIACGTLADTAECAPKAVGAGAWPKAYLLASRLNISSGARRVVPVARAERRLPVQ